MRGKREQARRLFSADRLIPAHAGKTQPRTLTSRRMGAHPRACGENAASGSKQRLVSGSSPRMRGKRCSRARRTRSPGLIPAHAGKTPACHFQAVLRGLIPAHAGKTRHSGSLVLIWWAHPRACGENEDRRGRLTVYVGSSPRMRGKRRRSSAPRRKRGLIPAHAGKTRFGRAGREAG